MQIIEHKILSGCKHARRGDESAARIDDPVYERRGTKLCHCEGYEPSRTRTCDPLVKRAVKRVLSSHGSYDLLTFFTGCSRFGVHLVILIHTCLPVFTSQICHNSATERLDTLLALYRLRNRPHFATACRPSLAAYNHSAHFPVFLNPEHCCFAELELNQGGS